ncbi:MAG: hypothetical protein HY328_00925 [Chloroflexi bacterium]|nr:hypothetical protein [Chloroflexota bacterium]
MGAADGKLATLVAATSPAALGMGVTLLVLGFVGVRLRKEESASLPAAVGFSGGAVIVQILHLLWT